MTTPSQPDQADPQRIADAVADRIGDKVPDPHGQQPDQAGSQRIADAVADRIGDKVPDVHGQQPAVPSVTQAIALREQAPEMYELWLKIAKDKAATANYVDRAPYEVPERLAQSGRPRALGALVIVLAFCGYLAWLGGPGPYIGGLVAILDLGVMFSMFFGLRPDRLPDSQPQERRRPPPRGLLSPARESLATDRAAARGPGLRVHRRPRMLIAAQPDRVRPVDGCDAGAVVAAAARPG